MQRKKRILGNGGCLVHSAWGNGTGGIFMGPVAVVHAEQGFKAKKGFAPADCSVANETRMGSCVL